MNILMICNTDGAMFNFRGPLIKKHVSNGDKVYCLCNTVDGYCEELYTLGVERVIDFNFGFSVRQAIVFPSRLKFYIEKYQITHIHIYTIACILFFLLISKIPQPVRTTVATFTGLGRIFGSKSSFFSRTSALLLFLKIFKNFHTIFFQNSEDFDYFSSKLSYWKDKYALVYGSGIEIEERKSNRDAVDNWRSKLQKHKKFSRLCLMASRLVTEKGYKDFYACADLLKRSHPDILFVHIGPLKREIILQGLSPSTENLIILPYSKEYKSLLELADVFVLPSYYREGVPRSLIEAVLFNKPIVTTDYSGCKHVVNNGKNGYLVPPKSPKELAEAILLTFDLDEELVIQTSKELIHDKFDINIHYNKNRAVYDRL